MRSTAEDFIKLAAMTLFVAASSVEADDNVSPRDSSSVSSNIAAGVICASMVTAGLAYYLLKNYCGNQRDAEVVQEDLIHNRGIRGRFGHYHHPAGHHNRANADDYLAAGGPVLV